MALAKQAVNIGILLLGAGSTRVEYKLKVQNTSIEVSPEYFAGGAYDETIGGNRISNLRGYRVTVSLNYDGSIEYAEKSLNQGSYSASTFREMFNDIVAAFSTGTIPSTSTAFSKLCVRVDQGSGPSDAIPTEIGSGVFLGFVPEEMSYTQQYSNQIGRFVPSMTLVSEDILPNIPEELQGVL